MKISTAVVYAAFIAETVASGVGVAVNPTSGNDQDYGGNFRAMAIVEQNLSRPPAPTYEIKLHSGAPRL